jgi:hypothetical protein
MGLGQESLGAEATTAGSGEVGGWPACDRRKAERRLNESWCRRAEDRRLCPGRRLLDWTSSDPRHRTIGTAP